MTNEITIDCPTCKVRISVSPDGEFLVGDDEFDTKAYFLCQCPTCRAALLGEATREKGDFNNWHWSHADRIWPDPDRVDLSTGIPEAAKKDLKDAQKCYAHGIYSAAAVLCGRSLERVSRDKTGERNFSKGLQKLLEMNVIDRKLFEWAEALRKERNVAAHASDEDVSNLNAKDLLDFTIAIYDYVYTLDEKYKKFIARKGKAEPDASLNSESLRSSL